MKKRKSWIGRCIPLVLGLVCVLSLIRPVDVKAETQAWPEGPQIDAPCAILMEANTGTILYEKNSTEQHYPASITKIMTTLLALEYCDMDEIVVFSSDAVFKNEGDTSHIARDLNEELTVEQCLYAIMLESANECSYAIAEHVGEKLGGDYQTFIDLMNQKAEELGCTGTHFNNCNGLPDPNHWVTARDMALIARAAYANETFRAICSCTSYTIPATNKHDEPYYCHNHHKMIYPWKSDSSHLYDYCTGGKTGYTDVARNTLVSFAEKDGISLVCVVLNCTSPNQYLSTRSLFEYGFSNYQALKISENETSITNEGMDYIGILNNNDAFASLDQNAYIILPKTASFSSATCEMNKNPDNGNIAELSYSYGGQFVGSATIVSSGAKASVAPILAKDTVKEETHTIIIRPLYIVLLVIALAAIGVLVYFGKRFYDNFYVIRHNWRTKREQNQRFRRRHSKRRRRGGGNLTFR